MDKTRAGIAGLLKLSLVDWPGKVAAVVFTRGCNLRCPWCQNPNLVDPNLFGETVPVEGVLEFLAQRRGFLDGLVATGGEPTLWPGLPAFLWRVKAMEYLVKLDTNGTRPDMVAHLLDAGLVDYVAVDYKILLRHYPKLGCPEPEKVRETISLVLARERGEVRTTVVPGLHTEELLEEMLAEFPELQDTVRFRLQPFRPGTCLDPAYNRRPRPSPEEITALARAVGIGVYHR